MDKQIPKWPELDVRWNKAGWPVLFVKPQPLPAAALRKAEQAAANEEWEDEGGALKPTLVPGPKLPL
jgi:hypothetical protein